MTPKPVALLSLACVLLAAAGAHANHPVAARDPSWTATVTRAPGALETAALAARPPAAVPGPLIGPRHALDGLASYYWQEQTTASGERFNRRDFTAAHKTLPFGTKVRVTHVGNGRSVVVRINDRGPFKPGRVIDLSEAAAEEIGLKQTGLAKVNVVVLGR
jgi:rare lipoprotein A